MSGVKITLVICIIGISYIFVNNKAKIQRCVTCVSLDMTYRRLLLLPVADKYSLIDKGDFNAVVGETLRWSSADSHKYVVKRWEKYTGTLYAGEGLSEFDMEKEDEVDMDYFGPDQLRVEFDNALKNI